jgi:hypothetical protein
MPSSEHAEAADNTAQQFFKILKSAEDTPQQLFTTLEKI